MSHWKDAMNEPSSQAARDAMPTMPPGPADDAAFEHARRLVAEGTDRAAAWWAAVERLAREQGLRP